MILYKKKKDLYTQIEIFKEDGKTIGFVPTMGALHAGHLSLITASLSENDITICSIFVNPAQFNDSNDFRKYPITIESDVEQLTTTGASILFLPNVEDIYPEGKPQDHYELGALETVLEGQYRPGHFQGVCQVLYRLFSIIKPHKAYFGQKDYQQCMVVKKLVEIMGVSVEVIIYPTVREADGLAMSSRNMRLSANAKQNATALYKALFFIKEEKNQFSIPKLVQKAKQMIAESNFESIDYLEICDAETLQPMANHNPAIRSVALVAAYIDGVRLIDNVLL